jgi:hypothetical protein
VSNAVQGRLWLAGGNLLAPVHAQIEIDGADVIATEVETGIFGVGPTLPAALTDLRSSLAQFRDVLERRQKLAAPLVRTLQFLRGHL